MTQVSSIGIASLDEPLPSVSDAVCAAIALKVMFLDMIPETWTDFLKGRAGLKKVLTPRRAIDAVLEQVNGVDRFLGTLNPGPCSRAGAEVAVRKVMPQLWTSYWLNFNWE